MAGTDKRTSRNRPTLAAMRHPEFPVFVRPLLSLYWLAHFFVTLVVLWSLQNNIGSHLSILWRLVIDLLSIPFTYVAYGYILLSATCLRRNPRWVIFLWHYRHVGALVMMLVSFVIPYVIPIRYEGPE
jgi:hypothetical protein